MSTSSFSHLATSWMDEMPGKRKEHRRNVALERQHQRTIRHHCNHCGNTKDENMRMCSLCKAAFYCDRNCQVADYQRTHKEQCRNFARAPVTRAFLTEPLSDDVKYAPDPVFARGNEHGIGVWVSVTGTMNCSLGQLIVPMRPPKDVSEMKARGDDPRKTKEHNAYAENLLTLQVLVQNRRLDKQPALIFPTRSAVVVDSRFATMGGRFGNGDCVRNTRGELLLGIAHDPWTDGPRFVIKNFNGMEIADDASLPAAVVNKKQGIVRLAVGEYVIMDMQFHLGSSTDMCKEWIALAFLPRLIVPLLAPFTADGKASKPNNNATLTQQVDAKFDADAINDYYSDYVTGGKHAFIRSHYGSDTAAAYVQDEQRMAKSTEAICNFLLSDPQRRASFLEDCRNGTIPSQIVNMFLPGLRSEI